ncbi:hypothetical protein I4F81_003766 [Pyropia yezoensis]|uniref:Uncharacterized protein n=1 Tax=Pyropia yezoensis TaxID=2788 RepID=A0ACC3BTG3_PYRYE|nr:hypothetical protein I4F81_003766 [Neopyropia yezoensis]
MTDAPFAALPVVAPLLTAVRQKMGYESMTLVQKESIPVSLRGGDVLCKAKTGSGKTLAFLIPALHRVLGNGPPPTAGRSLPILVISPTRELAQQIADEAVLLLSTFGGAPNKVQCVVGGTNVRSDVASFRRGFPTVLVGTPGRLNDHLQTRETGLADALRSLQVLIFDEADQLLDMGFRPAIEQLLSALPPKATRQTFLFSATMPRDVRAMVTLSLRPDYSIVDCVGEEEATNTHVSQGYFVTPVAHQFPALLHVLESARQAYPNNFKVIAFFATARMTQLAAELFLAMGVPVLEIHSRKSQPHRASVAAKFASGTGLVLFTSDVSARGVDYDDVTHVVQVGLPSDKAQYVHRLGRTGRAGKEGQGVLILSDFESSFLRQVSDLPLVQMPAPAPPAQLSEEAERVAGYLARLPGSSTTSAYQAWLGFYNSHLRKLNWSKEQLVAQANSWYSNAAHHSIVCSF